MTCEHMWTRKNEVNILRECGSEELKRDGGNVHRESGVPVPYGLRWEELWEMESQMRDAMRGSRGRVWVCANSGAGADRVASYE